MSQLRYTEQAFELPRGVHSLEGFRAWATSDDFPETGHISFLDGVIYVDMSPEKINKHNRIKTEVTSRIHALIDADDSGIVYGDRVLLSNKPANLSTEPDAMFAAWETLKSGRLREVPQKTDPDDALEVEGSPDWVLEIVSPSSMKKDKVKLFELYRRAGVREYWLIDAVSEDPLFAIHVLRDDAFERMRPDGDGWIASEVFGRRFRLDRERDPLGQWRYRLLEQA